MARASRAIASQASSSCAVAAAPSMPSSCLIRASSAAASSAKRRDRRDGCGANASCRTVKSGELTNTRSCTRMNARSGKKPFQTWQVNSLPRERDETVGTRRSMGLERRPSPLKPPISISCSRASCVVTQCSGEGSIQMPSSSSGEKPLARARLQVASTADAWLMNAYSIGPRLVSDAASDATLFRMICSYTDRLSHNER